MTARERVTELLDEAEPADLAKAAGVSKRTAERWIARETEPDYALWCRQGLVTRAMFLELSGIPAESPDGAIEAAAHQLYTLGVRELADEVGKGEAIVAEILCFDANDFLAEIRQQFRATFEINRNAEHPEKRTTLVGFSVMTSAERTVKMLRELAATAEIGGQCRGQSSE